AARMACRGCEMVGAGTLCPRATSVLATAWPSWLQPRPPASAANARRDGLGNRRRHSSNHEITGGEGNYRPSSPRILELPVRYGGRRQSSRVSPSAHLRLHLQMCGKSEADVITCPAALLVT